MIERRAEKSKTSPKPSPKTASPKAHREAGSTPPAGTAAFRDGQPAGPRESEVQVREAGRENMRDRSGPWDERDEASDESFPASDASAKY